MSALVVQLDRICISYSYDGLTIYQATGPIKFKRLKKMVLSQPEIYSFERLVERDDAEHDFYHMDNLDKAISHAHIKFKKTPTREQLSTMLQAFVTYNIITEIEKDTFFLSLEQRYSDARSKLEIRVDQTDAAREDIIINYLKQCEDNDILIDLHAYLLEQKFDYLRCQHADLQPWMGTNVTGAIVPTSKSWARIEKCIAFKMAMNFCEHTKFNSEIGLHAASQFTETHSFFAIKRKAGREDKLNHVAHDLANGERESLAKRYQKNF